MRKRIELFRKVMLLEEVEQVPAIPSVSGWVAKFSGLPLRTLLFDAGVMAKAQVRAQEAIGHDALFAYCDALYIPEAFGCPLVFRSSGPDVEPLEINGEEDIRSLPVPDCSRRRTAAPRLGAGRNAGPASGPGSACSWSRGRPIHKLLSNPGGGKTDEGPHQE